LEDVRPYRFPPLGKVKTMKGKTLDKHRNIPTHDMDKFMSDYVDSMDLSEFGKDGDGYAPSATYRPFLFLMMVPANRQNMPPSRTLSHR
jgi:ATP-dependent DNA helicase 2 subunit 2